MSLGIRVQSLWFGVYHLGGNTRFDQVISHRPFSLRVTGLILRKLFKEPR